MTVAPKRLAELQAREEARFAREHPRSRELAHKAREHLLAGVPMHWMAKWPGGFPLVVAETRESLHRCRRPMALMSPATTEEDVDRHTEVFREAALELVA